MNLKQFREYVEGFPKRYPFEYGISAPFSWRGSYDEVAFSITKSASTKEDVLDNIEKAYQNKFYGYKGGEYRYDDFTPVNFERESYRDYSDGGYTAEMIAEIEGTPQYDSQEERLVKIAFK